MTLLMRDQEIWRMFKMIENALQSTESIQQTVGILKAREKIVRKIKVYM